MRVIQKQLCLAGMLMQLLGPLMSGSLYISLALGSPKHCTSGFFLHQNKCSQNKNTFYSATSSPTSLTPFPSPSPSSTPSLSLATSPSFNPSPTPTLNPLHSIPIPPSLKHFLSTNQTPIDNSECVEECVATTIGLLILALHFIFDLWFALNLGWVIFNKTEETDCRTGQSCLNGCLNGCVKSGCCFWYLIGLFLVPLIFGAKALAGTSPFAKINLPVGCLLVVLCIPIGFYAVMLCFAVLYLPFGILFYSALQDPHYKYLIIYYTGGQYAEELNYQNPIGEEVFGTSVANLLFENIIEVFIVAVLFSSDYFTWESILFSLPMFLNTLYSVLVLTGKVCVLTGEVCVCAGDECCSWIVGSFEDQDIDKVKDYGNELSV